MTKDDRNMLIFGGVATAAMLGFGWWAFADDKEEDAPLPGPGPKPRPGPPGDPRYCDLDGQLYDSQLFPDPATVVETLAELGYPISSVTSPAGKLQVQAFQSRARQLDLRGYANAPESYIDAIVGACTLRSLEHALELDNAGEWPNPMEPL